MKIETSSRVGFPDRLFFMPGGYPLFIEFKKQGKKATKKQQQVIRDLVSLKYDAIVCDNVDDAIKYMEGRMDAALLSTRCS